MTTSESMGPLGSGNVLSELRKLPAFLRRDFLVAWSYRLAFFSDAANLIFQSGLFYFVSLMVDPSTLPSYGESPSSYLAFVAVGIALGGFLQLGLNQVSAAVRSEQVMGTLESLFMTPTRPSLLQVGLAVYNFVYIPIRTALFLALIAGWFDIDFKIEGIFPAMIILMLFIPLVWGIGLVGAAFVMTFRRGSGFVGIVGFVLTVTSGAYFPVGLFPDWVEPILRYNPVGIAFEGSRQALLGGATTGELTGSFAVLAVGAVVALWVGSMSMNWALRRERRLGTLGHY